MFQFRFTHKKYDDRYVGVLPGSTPGMVAFAYEAPSKGGQVYERTEEEFKRLFSKL